MSIFSIARTYRNLRRMKEIVQVLSRYGFGHLVVRMNLLSHIPVVSRIGRVPDIPSGLTPMQDLALRARLVLEELGPTFVKLGQVLSSRPDIMGEEFVEQFRHLQDRVAPFDGRKAREAVRESLDCDFEGVFSRFDETPVASGSIGQVHRAALLDGTEVVVKVKRPGVDSRVRDDLNVLKVLAQLAEQYMPEARVLRPLMVVDEFSHQIERELDFVTEAASTSQFESITDEVPAVRVPRVYWEYTSRDVLCLECIQGVNIGNVARLREMGLDTKVLARTVAEAFLVQFFGTGHFHADPHPGNILVSDDGRIGLIDFGMVGHLTDEVRGHLGTLIFAMLRRDVDLIVDLYRELGVFSDVVEARELKPDIQEMMDRYFGVPLGKIETEGVFQDILKLGRKYQGTLPRDFVLLGKALVSVGSLTKQLDPGFDLIEMARPYTLRLVREKFSPRRLTNIAVGTGWALANLLRRLPGDLTSILRKIKGGTLKGIVRHEGLEGMQSEVERASNRLTLGLLLSSLVVGSSLVTAAGIGPKIWTDVPVLGSIGFALAALLALTLALTILRSGRI